MYRFGVGCSLCIVALLTPILIAVKVCHHYCQHCAKQGSLLFNTVHHFCHISVIICAIADTYLIT